MNTFYSKYAIFLQNITQMKKKKMCEKHFSTLFLVAKKGGGGLTKVSAEIANFGVS